MPEISPLGPSARPRLVSSSQFVDDQIGVVRRRVAAAVEKGALTGDDAAAIVRRLDEIQKDVDAGAANASLSRSALRRTSEELHAINRQVALASRPAVAAKPAAPGRVDITA